MDIKVYYDNYEKLKYACEYSEQKLLMAKEQIDEDTTCYVEHHLWVDNETGKWYIQEREYSSVKGKINKDDELDIIDITNDGFPKTEGELISILINSMQVYKQSLTNKIAEEYWDSVKELRYCCAVNLVYIDAYFTDDEDEEGVNIATISDMGEIYWLNKKAQLSKKVMRYVLDIRDKQINNTVMVLLRDYLFNNSTTGGSYVTYPFNTKISQSFIDYCNKADKEYMSNQEIAVKIKAVNNTIYGFMK